MTIEKYIRGAFAGMALMAMAATTLTACSTADETDDIATPTTRATINISAADAYDSEETRAANTGVTTASENSINRVFIAALSKSGNVVGSTEFSVSGTPTKYSYDASSLNMVDGGKVIVAVNCPSGTFNGQTTETGLKSRYLTIANALHQSGTSEYGRTTASFNNLPMFGEATATYNGTNNISADVFIYHLVSKITLSSITVDPMGGSFAPKEIFMVNVPESAAVCNVTPYSEYNFHIGSKKYSGELTDASCNASNTGNVSYLSSGSSSWTFSTVDSKNVFNTNMPEFYVTPSSATDLGKGGAIMLVIKGIYNDGTGDETCYYPVPINYITSTGKSADGHDPRTVNPNVNYKLTVSIKGKGSDTPYIVPDITTISVNVIAVSFTKKTSPYYYEPVRIGDYLFNDGWWGPIPDDVRLITKAHHPIAVIFSNETSPIDKAFGWTHGYALSLASCGWKLAASSTDRTMKSILSSSVANYTGLDASFINSNYHDPANATTKDAVLADLDGYLESLSYEYYYTNIADQTIGVNLDYKARDDYPSLWYALNFSTSQVGITVNNVKTGASSESTDLTSTNEYAISSQFICSGWYLGSVGQYYLAAKNLGGNFTDSRATFEADDGSVNVEGQAYANISNINRYITKGNNAYSRGVQLSYSLNNYGTWYYTSSAYDENDAYTVSWTKEGLLTFSPHGKSDVDVDDENRGVRPVIAW